MFNIRSLFQRKAPSISGATGTSPDSKSSAPKFYNAATHPFASALFVFHDPNRIQNFHYAMQRFATQKWPFKEIVVVNSTDVELSTPVVGARIISIKARYLGELKNLALYNAKGEWCFPWLDDCDYKPEYMDWHMHRRSKAFPTVVSNPHAHVFKDNISQAVEWDAAPCASFFRFSPYIYDQDGSDVRFLNNYPEKNFASADAGLVTRFFEDYE